MFWVNDPSTVSPITADNLARAERYLLATAGANGDFYVTIPNGVNLAVNDVVHITFPAATNGASAARLSIDGGTTWKTINTNAGRLASAFASRKVALCYDGTNWVPLEPISWIDGTFRVTHYPDGRSAVKSNTSSSTGTLVMTEISTSGIFGSAEMSLTLPTGAFLDAQYDAQMSVFSSSYVLGFNPQYDTCTNIALKYVVIKGGSSTSAVSFRVNVVGQWK